MDERKREYDVSGASGRFVVIPVSGTRWGVYDCAYHKLIAERTDRDDLPMPLDLDDELVEQVRRVARDPLY